MSQLCGNKNYFLQHMHSTKQDKSEQDEIIICHKNRIESTQ